LVPNALVVALKRERHRLEINAAPLRDATARLAPNGPPEKLIGLENRHSPENRQIRSSRKMRCFWKAVHGRAELQSWPNRADLAASKLFPIRLICQKEYPSRWPPWCCLSIVQRQEIVEARPMPK